MTLPLRFFLATLCSFALSSALRAADPDAAASATPAATNSPAAALLRDFFADPDAAKRAALAEKFAPLAPKSWDVLRAMLRRAAAYAALKPGRQTFQTAGAAGPSIKYVLRVPANYKPDGDVPWPLIVACHATEGTGDGFVSFVENLLGPDVENFLVACPDSPDQEIFHPTRVAAEYPLAVLDDLRHRANLDSNRTVVLGYSKGGYTAWFTALFAPGQWAGAMPMACMPLTPAGATGVTLYLPNVLDLALQAHWGETDLEPGQKQGINTFNRDIVAEMKRLGAKKFAGLEYPHEGHSLALQTAPARAFLAAARRNPFPTEGHLIFHALWQGRAWYVRALAAAREDFDFTGQVKVSVAGPDEIPQAVRAYFLKVSFDLQVRLRPADNTIIVLAKDLKELEIELPAEKLDWTRPVRVVVNSTQLFAGKRPVDYAELLETARRTYDFERLIAGRLHWPAAK